jgi:hypothetical protein
MYANSNTLHLIGIVDAVGGRYWSSRSLLFAANPVY